MGSQIVFTMKSLIFLFISVLWVAECKTPPPYEGMDKYVSQYELPDLPYDYDQLEPFIDEETVAIHYEEHHYEYTNNLNSAIGMWRAQSPTLGMRSLIEILMNVDEIKEPYHGAIKQFAGGYLNHNFYWSGMSPNPKNVTREPKGKLLGLIKKHFESFTEFKRMFSTKAHVVFGSGYAWLTFKMHPNNTEELEITTTNNQDCPLSDGYYPLLVIDVWEHAYYLKHQHLRTSYVTNWWRVVDWNNVEQLLKWWKKFINKRKKDEL